MAGDQNFVDLFNVFDGGTHRMLREAADRGPVATDAMSGAVVILRQRDVEALSRDKRLAGIGLAMFDMMEITGGPLRDWYSSLMFTNEGQYHHRIRSLVSRAFTPRSVEALRETAAEMAAAAVADVTDEGDLVAACAPLGTRLICRMLGIPDSDVDIFGKWADALSPVFNLMTPDEIAVATHSIVQLQEYVRELTAERTRDPGPDLITAMLAAEGDGERLSHAEVVTMIANLLVAGHDTAGSQIPCSILVALCERDKSGAADWVDTRLASGIAETMRVEPSVTAIPRTCTEPIDLYGTTIPVGSIVLLCLASANRDPSAWSDPEIFDPDRFTRPDTPKLLSFGAGAHFCLGTSLAKLAVEEAVRAVLTAEEPLALAQPPYQIPWRQVLGRSPAKLTVRRRSMPTTAAQS